MRCRSLSSAPDGYILTSAVLVSGLDHAARIHVTVPDGRRASARLVGIDDSGGLAVLHVSGLGDLVPATFADVGGVTVEQSGTTVRSGMALLDLRAKVVGVYATSSAGSVIPADQAVRAVVEIIASTR